MEEGQGRDYFSLLTLLRTLTPPKKSGFHSCLDDTVNGWSQRHVPSTPVIVNPDNGGLSVTDREDGDSEC